MSGRCHEFDPLTANTTDQYLNSCGRCGGDRRLPREMRDHMDSCHEASGPMTDTAPNDGRHTMACFVEATRGHDCICGLTAWLNDRRERAECRRCDGTGMVGRDWPAGAGRRTCPTCRGCGVEQ